MERPLSGKPARILALFAGIILLAIAWQWVDGIPLGMASAVVLAPLKNRMDRKLPGWLSAALVTLALLLLLSAATLATIQAMQENLGTNEKILGGIATGLGTLSPQFGLLGIPEEPIREVVSGIESSIEAIATFWTSLSLASVLLSPRALAFFPAFALTLWKGDRLLRAVLMRLPPGWMALYPRLATVAVDTLYAVLVVHLIMVALTFGLALPFFALLGYGDVVYLSLATAFCELVPVLGASVPMVILLLYAFSLGDLLGFVLVFAVGYLIVALLPELTVRPILMGRRASLSPYVMFFGFMGGILLLGMAGFLLGPLALALAVTWYRIRKEGRAQVREPTG